MGWTKQESTEPNVEIWTLSIPKGQSLDDVGAHFPTVDELTPLEGYGGEPAWDVAVSNFDVIEEDTTYTCTFAKKVVVTFQIDDDSDAEWDATKVTSGYLDEGTQKIWTIVLGSDGLLPLVPDDSCCISTNKKKKKVGSVSWSGDIPNLESPILESKTFTCAVSVTKS